MAVRVLDCGGSGTNAQVIGGIDWVIGNHAAGQPAVANMSLGGGANSALDTAIRNLHNDGVTVVVAAGNETADACTKSPARVAQAITVAASDSDDGMASFSNGGTCVDLFAPGVGVLSAWSTSNTATNTISGTSMSSPHVAGAAARHLQASPGSSPTAIASAHQQRGHGQQDDRHRTHVHAAHPVPAGHRQQPAALPGAERLDPHPPSRPLARFGGGAGTSAGRRARRRRAAPPTPARWQPARWSSTSPADCMKA